MVEKYIEFYNDPFEGVAFVCGLFSHEETILLFQNVLDLADDVGPPNYLPVLVGIVPTLLDCFP